MKIAPTKVLASKLNKALAGTNAGKEGAIASQIELNRDYFIHYVDMDAYRHEEDWDMAKGKFKVLTVQYADDLYTTPMYWTSEDLRKVARELRDNGKELTEENFINELVKAVER